MTDVSRQIASDASVIAIALIAASFVLIAVVWKIFDIRLHELGFEQRKELGRSLIVLLAPVLFLYAVATFVGSKWPDLLEPSGIAAMLLLILGFLIYFVVSKIMHLRRRHQQKPMQLKLDDNLVSCSWTLAILGLSVMCSALSLFGVISIALSVKLPNVSSYDFYLSRWLLLDGVAFFVSGILGTVYSVITGIKSDDKTTKTI